MKLNNPAVLSGSLKSACTKKMNITASVGIRDCCDWAGHQAHSIVQNEANDTN